MSGHSKWATIKHKKAKEDNKRGKVFTKLIREIMVAARQGGGDPAGNPRLRVLIDKAKAENMPQDNITRAIKKATGELEGMHFEEVIYEGYGPEGTAAIIEALTDNKNRTVADLRHIFSKYGGNMGETGSVAWMFEHKGVIRAIGSLSEDDVIEKLLDYEVDDVSLEESVFTITCNIKDLYSIKTVVEKIGMRVEDAKVEWVAKNTITLSARDQEEKVIKFLEALEDYDDVRDVYSNIS